MAMAPKWADLQKMSDADLIEIYDGATDNTVVGTKFFYQELNRRAAGQLDARLVKLTRWIMWLTVAVVALTAVILIVTVIDS